MTGQEPSHRIGRRAFLRGGTLFLAGSALLSGDLFAATEDKPKLRCGLVTDLHYADKDSRGTRYYRESLTKLAEASEQFDKEKPDLVVELGDLIDGTDSVEVEKGHLRRIAREFAAIPGQHHCVVGNHCVNNLTKPEFLGIIGQEKSFYSFDANGYHFVVLDACFTSDGVPYGRKKVHIKWGDAAIPPAELEWLQADLRQSPHKSIVFAHQCLDVIPPFGVKNGPAVRKLLEESGKVLAVLQGHWHRGNYQELGGIHYCTLKAVVEGSGPENNAYAMMDILPGDGLRITGFRKQPSYRWP
jgi:alkaline phosphatase